MRRKPQLTVKIECHGFRCMECEGWKSSDHKRIQWNNLIVCDTCFEEKPPHYNPPKLYPNEGKPVDNPSPRVTPTRLNEDA